MARPKKAAKSANAYAEISEADQPESIDWDDFRIFLAIVKAGSLNRAADLLDIVQPTVSRRLARLEKNLGIRLFERSTSGPRLTFEGRRVLNSASTAQLSLAQAARSAQEVRPKIEGECKLIMGDGLATYWMPLFLSTFFDRYPNVELKNFVAQMPWRERTKYLTSKFTITSPQISIPSRNCISFRSPRQAICASMAHRARRKTFTTTACSIFRSI